MILDNAEGLLVFLSYQDNGIFSIFFIHYYLSLWVIRLDNIEKIDIWEPKPINDQNESIKYKIVIKLILSIVSIPFIRFIYDYKFLTSRLEKNGKIPDTKVIDRIPIKYNW